MKAHTHYGSQHAKCWKMLRCSGSCHCNFFAEKTYVQESEGLQSSLHATMSLSCRSQTLIFGGFLTLAIGTHMWRTWLYTERTLKPSCTQVFSTFAVGCGRVGEGSLFGTVGNSISTVCDPLCSTACLMGICCRMNYWDYVRLEVLIRIQIRENDIYISLIWISRC